MSGYRTNAEVIAAAAQLGYIRPEMLTLDATYERGRFWNDWRPLNLFTNDINPKYGQFHHDYRALPWASRVFDCVVFDPPYKLKGTGGSHPSDEGYGVATPYAHWTDVFFDIHDGIDECMRVLAVGGTFLLKCMDQVSGGHKRWTRGFVNHVERLGGRHVDTFCVNGYRKQPEGKIQRRSRTDHSMLHVFLKEAA